MNVTASEGDTVDLLCWRHYGKSAGVTEQVYQANPGLCDKGALLPAGTVVYLPEIARKATREVIQLWD
ncbi:tail protein X [Enterobacter cancerogenus]|uniref:tail protein X n=1 Tax=Enterobacter cancerogenus TaxID=69218 RepID=UPI001299CD7D|nr:tail protein X [Enterobacter cancerogenus]QGG11413.1 phage tail protein [Enterobacter cancerogenus]